MLVTDDSEMADILNSHYCNMFTREDLSSMPRVEKLFKGENILSTVSITEDKVKAKLKKLKPSSAPGPDRVWIKVLHDLADQLSAPLAIIYKKLLEEEAVPEIWLKSLVCPIFKKGTKSDPGNYRPVSLTCVVGKVMEYLEALSKWLDEGKSFDVIYCDFAKAFDKVPWERLLAKMKGMGVGGNLLGWVRQWLIGGRLKSVVLNGQQSLWRLFQG